MEWQPIETAPKDGTVFASWNRHQPTSVRFICWGKPIYGRGRYEAWITLKGNAVLYPPEFWLLLPLPEPPTR